jgi:hypothetical protein
MGNQFWENIGLIAVQEWKGESKESRKKDDPVMIVPVILYIFS